MSLRYESKSPSAPEPDDPRCGQAIPEPVIEPARELRQIFGDDRFHGAVAER
jgi:hypothetical protein